MLISKVIGNVVATKKVHQYDGFKLMLVAPCDSKGKLTGAEKVAIDVVGAGVGEVVFIVEGSSARMAIPGDGKCPVDATIIGIIDTIEIENKIVFKKS